MKYAVAAMLAVSMVVTGCAGSSVKDSGTSAAADSTGNSAGDSTGNSGENGAREKAGNGTRDDVVVVMGPTSEPEAGFDPAYGWGAGEHVHEPLIQSTLTVTTAAENGRSGFGNTTVILSPTLMSPSLSTWANTPSWGMMHSPMRLKMAQWL